MHAKYTLPVIIIIPVMMLALVLVGALRMAVPLFMALVAIIGFFVVIPGSIILSMSATGGAVVVFVVLRKRYCNPVRIGC